MNSLPPGTRVLLVEDEVMVSWVAHDMLADLGCVVIGPAMNVHQALETVATEAIDAAVLDINLAGELSYAVADVLAAHGVPYVLVTGYNRERVPAAYQSVPVLQKPLRRGDLGDAIAKSLAMNAPTQRGSGRGGDSALPASQPSNPHFAAPPPSDA